MKRTLLIFFIVTAFGSVFSQFKFGGTVRDAETGEKLAAASVLIGGKGTSTDQQGVFVFNDIKEGVYNFKLSYVGYETVHKEIDIKGNTEMNFSLYQTEILSDQIVVTASRNEQTIGDVAGRISLISGRMVNSYPKRSTDDLLKTTSAVFVDRSSGIFSHSSVVNVRGITAGEQGRVLVMLDGEPINKSDGGTVNFNRIDPDNIERVEIFKGPGSSIYGNNAMGGVINFLTKKSPKHGYHISGGINYYTYNTIEEKLSVSSKLESKNGLYFRISGFNRTSDGYNTYLEKYRDAFSVNSDLKETGVDAKVGYELNDKTNIQIDYTFYDDSRGSGTKVLENNIMKHKTNYGSLSFNTELSDIKLNFNAFLQMENYLKVMEKYKANGTTISSYDLIDVDADRDDLGANFDVTVPISNMILTAGAELKLGKIDGSDIYRTTYDKNSNQYIPGSDILTNKGNMTTIAGFINDEWKIADDFKISAGLRFDNVKFTDGEYIVTDPSKNNDFLLPFAGQLKEYNWTSVTPKISAQYSFAENFSMYAAYSQGFRAATLDDLTRPGLIKLGFKNANPELQPEKIENIELGFNYDIEKSLYIMPSFYYMTGNDFMAYFGTADTINIGGKKRPIIIKNNISKVRFLGGDIDIKYFFDANLSVFGNFAYVDTEILDYEGNPDLVGKKLTHTPDILANFGITYLNEYVNGTINVHYQGKQFLNDDNSEADKDGNRMIIEANATVDLKVWKRIFNMFNISVEVQNLFDVTTLSTYDRYSLGRFITGGITFDL